MQPNLVIRDGELEGELEKMRVLTARAGGKVEGIVAKGGDSREGTVDVREEHAMNQIYENNPVFTRLV